MEALVIGPNSDSEALITVFLHGFPAIRSKQNREIAEHAAKTLGRETHVLFYDGLGHAAGTFSFSQCLFQVGQYFSELVEKRPKVKIDIVGHSWGGYLALSMATRFAPYTRRMVLMSPLLVFPEVDMGVRAMYEYARLNPTLALGDTEVLAADFAAVGRDAPSDEIIASVSDKIEMLFLQSRNDDVTYTKFAVAAVEKFKRRPTFELLDTDHSFVVDRPQISQRVAKFLA